MKTLKHVEMEVIEAIIRKCDICYVGVVDGDLPYVLPMNFGYRDNTIYLHSAPVGRIIDILNKNNNICVTFSTDHELAYVSEEIACSYRMKSKSVIANGKVLFVEDMDEKRKCLNVLMEQYSDLKFEYRDPAVKNVKIWKVPIDQVSCKEFGAPHDKYRQDRALEELKKNNK